MASKAYNVQDGGSWLSGCRDMTNPSRIEYLENGPRGEEEEEEEGGGGSREETEEGVIKDAS